MLKVALKICSAGVLLPTGKEADISACVSPCMSGGRGFLGAGGYAVSAADSVADQH